MKKILLASICLLFSLSAHSQPNNPFSIDDVLSSPFPSGLVASGSGEHLAWVENKQGVRNIWVAIAPDYVGKQLTSYEKDEGQSISSLIFTDDNSSLIYVKGDGANRKGEFPNPAIIPQGTEREIRQVQLNDKSDMLLATGASPQLSPVDDGIAFISKGQIWYKEPDAEAKQLFKIRGGANSIRWSPAGDKLAFVSSRGDHSFIGVYDISNDQLTYLNPSVDRDMSPVWSPDGTQIAYLRIPNARNQLIFEPHREGYPWSIMVAEVASGNARELWKADEGTGSVFRNVSATNQIFWSTDGYIVFPWEKYGWTNLFSVKLSNGEVTRLTKGEFEVQFVNFSSVNNEVYYSSNQGDIDRQHIWKSTMKGVSEQLTSGEGVEWWPVPLSPNKIGYLGSGGTTPAQAFILQGDDRMELNTNSLSGFPTDDLVKPEQVRITAADGMIINAQLFKPAKVKKGERHPAVIFFHGGSRRQMLLGFHHRGYYHHAYALNQYLASQGYIVLSVNYRSGIGYGMKFREALNYGATGASEFNDVLGAGLYLKSRPDVLPDKIGLWGGSYGGYLTALGLARASHLFAAGVDIHGVHDWNVIVNNFIPSYNPNSRKDFAKLAFDSSPMAFIDTWTSPVLLIHGDDDRNVPFSETVDIAESLRKQNVDFEQLIFPDEVHGFLLHQNWVDAYKATADFFERKLKN